MIPDDLTRQTLDGTLWHHATHRPDHLAILDRDRRFTYAELEQLVARMASGLRAAG